VKNGEASELARGALKGQTDRQATDKGWPRARLLGCEIVVDEVEDAPTDANMLACDAEAIRVARAAACAHDAGEGRHEEWQGYFECRRGWLGMLVVVGVQRRQHTAG
jgi:hypothetical protein